VPVQHLFALSLMRPGAPETNLPGQRPRPRSGTRRCRATRCRFRPGAPTS